MRSVRHIFPVVLLALVPLPLARAQIPAPGMDVPAGAQPPVLVAVPAVLDNPVPIPNPVPVPPGNATPTTLTLPAAPVNSVPAVRPAALAVQPAALQQNVDLLNSQLEAAQGQAQPDQTLQKKVELLQKQLNIQQEMIKLLLKNMTGQGKAGPAVEKLQGQVSTLEARSRQGAQRDVEVQQAIDNINEHMDAEELNGPRLPANLKELFLPSKTNETPVSIYGQFLENYTQFNSKPGVFSSPDFSPYFFVQLNNEFLLAANIDINNGGVSASEIQIDWFVNDWLTVVVGRYLAQIGYFNERLNHEWINRLPDPPLMFRQVSPQASLDGIMLRGGVYIGCTPVKLEYSVYGGNGLQAGTAPVTVNDVANLQNITGGPDEQDVKAIGGRLGFVVPEWGLTGGISTYFNGRYSSAFPDQFNLWQLDLGYRHGNWDARFEYADVHQQAASYIGNNIRRQGMYAQLAYRAMDSDCEWLRRLEVAVRYSRVWFRGIDPTQIDPTLMVDAPLNRDQWTIGLNYYFYPSMALRVAYEFNREFDNINLHDNVFLAQYVWAF
jgi:hypothetical protein